MQVLASQLPFLANRNAELAVPPLLGPVNCRNIGWHVALLSGPTVYTLYCGAGCKSVVQILSCVDLISIKTMERQKRGSDANKIFNRRLSCKHVFVPPGAGVFSINY